MVRSNLEANISIMQTWFYENHMVLTAGNCHYMFLGNDDEPDKIYLN